MAKGLNLWCEECIFLDKGRKQESENGTSCFRYGCNARTKDPYICGWIRDDKELKTMGCGYCNRIRVGDIITKRSFFSECVKNWLYCGKVKNNKRLLYCVKTKEYRVVENDFVRSQTGKIKSGVMVVKQTKEQIEFHKKVARRMKGKWKENNE